MLMCASVTSQNFEAKIETELKKIKAPSVQYVFFTKNDILFWYSDGFLNIDQRIKADENTVYHAFSATKTFTAVAIMQLVEKNKLKLNESVKNILPELSYSENITVKHLLTHTSGIRNPLPLKWIHLAEEHQDFDNKSFIKKVLEENKKTKFQPHEKFAYSNIEFILLAMIIERVSGSDFETYIQQNIFKKIGVGTKELSFQIDTSHLAVGYHPKVSFSNLLFGFFINKKKFMEKSHGKWKPFKPFYMNAFGYSGILASSNGMVKFGQALLDGKSILMEQESKNLMFTENILNNGIHTGMCLSWFKGNLSGNDYYCHAGGGGGYYCEIRVYPSLGYGSVIMINKSGMKDVRILDRLDIYQIERNGFARN